MGDLPRWKIEKIWSGRVIMGDLPRWKECEVRSHYNGWPTQVEDRKNVKWSRYNGWLTQVEDIKNVKWSHCYGWPTQMKDVMWQVWKMGLTWRSPEGMIEEGPENLAPSGCRLTWRLLLMTGLISSFLWDSPTSRVHLILFSFQDLNRFFVILNSMIFFFYTLVGLHWGSFCNKSQVCAMLWG